MEFTMESVLAEIYGLDKRIERLEAQLEDARHLQDALQLTVNRFSPQQTQRSRRTTDLNVDPDDVRGLSLQDALVLIANRHDGIVHSRSARPVLIDAGVLRGNGDTASHTLCTMLTNSQFFTKVSIGKYRLLDDDIEAA